MRTGQDDVVDPQRGSETHVGGMTISTRPQTESPRRYETLAAVADRTGMSTRTLRRWIADGSLPAYRTGRRIIRVSPDGVDRLMAQMPSGALAYHGRREGACGRTQRVHRIQG